MAPRDTKTSIPETDRKRDTKSENLHTKTMNPTRIEQNVKMTERELGVGSSSTVSCDKRSKRLLRSE